MADFPEKDAIFRLSSLAELGIHVMLTLPNFLGMAFGKIRNSGRYLQLTYSAWIKSTWQKKEREHQAALLYIKVI